VVATTFPVSPLRGGGQIRVFELYRRLAAEVDVDVVALCRPEEPGREHTLAPGLREICVPKTPEHESEEAEASRSVDWLPITDIAMTFLYDRTPAYLRALDDAAAHADAVVACHPYVLPAIRAVTDRPLWYEAQDVELDLKRPLLPGTAAGEDLLERTRAVEERCCREAELVLTCSRIDARRLRELYSVPASRLVDAPNGVDAGAVRFVPGTERAAIKRELGLSGRFFAIFVGSWHVPNVDALLQLLEIAALLPHVDFLALGSACSAVQDVTLPPNVGFLGSVDGRVKRVVLEVADVALNPMRLGSGTNLKMLEYAACGVPVLSTPHGARGLRLVPGEHVETASVEEFPARIERLRADPAYRSGLALNARRLAVREYSWDVIASRLWAELGRGLAWNGALSGGVGGR
jgi:glycosyltransferase involved in cell wall biosynthesis